MIEIRHRKQEQNSLGNDSGQSTETYINQLYAKMTIQPKIIKCCVRSVPMCQIQILKNSKSGYLKFFGHNIRAEVIKVCYC